MKHFVVLALVSCLLVVHTTRAQPLDLEEPQKLTLEDVDAQPIDDGSGVRVARFFGGGRGGFCCGGGGGGFRRGGFGGGGFGRRGGYGGGPGFGGGGGSASASASASASSSFGK